MRWQDIEDNKRTIPPEIAKNGRRHVVPLAPLVNQCLADLRTKGEEHLKKTSHPGLQSSIPVYVFYSDTGTCIEWLTKALDRINLQCGFKERFTAHDLRRCCATGMSSSSQRTLAAAVQANTFVIWHKGKKKV